ncbi:MAG: efflux RND transporter periplasmic adaptor subunit [Gammaproteobacteria bacterium]|jgi:membrane fusion protein (multidrug efflux system)
MAKRMVIVLLLLALLLGGIFGWKYYQARQAAALASRPPPPATVAATEVQVQSWRPWLSAIGSLVANQGILVTNEVAGKVSEIRFESGERVAAGELLLRLDDSVDQAELEGIMAERHLAELQFRRRKELVEKKSISRSDYDEAQLRLENATAQLATRRALIDKKRITAPFAGWLGIRRVDLGDYLAPGSAIVPLESLQPIFVDYTLPERFLARITPGQRVEVEVQAWPGEVFEGRISAIDPGIDPGTRNVKIRATLQNPEEKLRPGMFAEVRTLQPERSGVLTLPQTAITYNPYGDAVFVIESRDGGLQVQRRQVTTGEVRDGHVEIISGLAAGDRVVSAGQVKLRNGQAVVIDNSVALEAQITRP